MLPSPPPPPPPAPAPALIHDLVEEILLRLPPDDPGCLFRASLACKPWRSLLTSPTFARRYRDFHRTPPLLGFFERDYTVSCWFSPLSPTSPFLPIHPGRRDLRPLDSRHGLVLLKPGGADEEEPTESLIVWDPVGRRQWEISAPEIAQSVTYDNGAVLCAAADGCDHLGCRGGPFLVAYVGTDDDGIAHACVFSSEARTWSSVTSCENPALPDLLEILRAEPKCLVGNALYFACGPSTIILQYNLFSRELSMIDGPDMGQYDDYLLMTTEDGVLGCASVQEQESRLCLWSTETGPHGAVAWTRRRVVELEKLLPSRAHSVVGVADGVGVFFLSTTSGIFTIELKSCRVKKVSINGFDYDHVIPYMSFYTPDQAGDITLLSTMVSSWENVEEARDEYHDPLLLHSSRQVGDEEGKGEEKGEWEEEDESEEEGEQEEEKTEQELFDKGSKAIEEGDFVGAVGYLGRALEIRVAHYGKLSPRCFNTYYKYGCALLYKAHPKSAPNQESLKGTTSKNDIGNSEDSYLRRQFWSDLDLAWKMLHIARAILEKSPGSTMEKVEIFAALAEVSMQREDIDYSLSACFKALAILEHLVEPDHRHIIDLNFRICLAFELASKIGDAIPYCAKAISLCKSHIQNLKKAKGALLADKGDNASAAEVGSEKSSLDDDIEFITDILTLFEKKLEELEQAISTPVSKASGEQNVGNAVLRAASLTSSQIAGPSNAMPTAAASGSTGTDLGAVGRGIKRANDKQISAEPCPKKPTEDSPSVKGDSSDNSDVHPMATDGDGSVSE